MAKKNRERYTFTERRELILESIDLLQNTFNDMTFDEFERDWRNVDSAKMRLTAIGELLHENAGHSPAFSDAFNNFRNEQPTTISAPKRQRLGECLKCSVLCGKKS